MFELVKTKMKKRLITVILVVALIGVVDASVLTVKHYEAFRLPCAFSGGCEQVLTSRYATVGMVPVATLGIAYYLAVFGIGLFLRKMGDGRLGWTLLALTAFGMAFSGWLVYLQVAVIGYICQYCLISAGSSLILFVSAILMRKSLGRAAVNEKIS